jgi:hypothetical protein
MIKIKYSIKCNIAFFMLILVILFTALNPQGDNNSEESITSEIIIEDGVSEIRMYFNYVKTKIICFFYETDKFKIYAESGKRVYRGNYNSDTFNKWISLNYRGSAVTKEILDVVQSLLNTAKATVKLFSNKKVYIIILKVNNESKVVNCIDSGVNIFPPGKGINLKYFQSSEVEEYFRKKLNLSSKQIDIIRKKLSQEFD